MVRITMGQARPEVKENVACRAGMRAFRCGRWGVAV